MVARVALYLNIYHLYYVDMIIAVTTAKNVLGAGVPGVPNTLFTPMDAAHAPDKLRT